jgi:hypothetical protein
MPNIDSREHSNTVWNLNLLMENIEPEQVLLLDSESMPPQAFLLHPSSDDEMAWERESLFDTALSLAVRMTVTLFTSQILEDELKDAIRFLKSDEHPPGISAPAQRFRH